MEQENHSPSYLEEPQVSFLSRVLEDIRNGGVVIPRFQRHFVWKIDDRLQLFDSINRGIPIGSLLVWRTTTTELDSFHSIGGISLRIPNSPTGLQFLLDGHQRMSTLFSALTYVENPDELVDPGEYGLRAGDAYYDLHDDEFRILPLNRALPNGWMPLSILFNSIQLLKFQRELQETDFFTEELIEKIDRLANRFRSYKIPLIPLVTNDLEAATTAFQRINSSGTPLSHTHMVVALTYSEGFDLADRLKQAKRELRTVGWGGFSSKFILAVVRAQSSLEISRPDVEQTSEVVKNDPSVLDAAVTAIKLAAGFLRTRCLIPSPDFLPYSYQGVLLALAFSQNIQVTEEIEEALNRWVWLTTYTGLFRGAREKDVNAARDLILEVLGGEFNSLEEMLSNEVFGFPDRYDFRSARIKSMAVRMAEHQIQLDESRKDSTLDFMAKHGSGCLVSLLGSSQFSDSGSRSLENRLLVGSAEEFVVQDEETEISESLQRTEFREKHLISEIAFAAYNEGELSEFLSCRKASLMELESTFVANLGLDYPSQ